MQAKAIYKRDFWESQLYKDIKDVNLVSKVLTDLLAALKSEAAGYYRTLASTQPRKAKFLKGWLKRAYA